MTTATITCHDVYNFGASLQAYALQQWQLKHGIENVIINYKPSYLSGHYSFKSINPKYDRPFVRWAYWAAKFYGRWRSLTRKRKFDEFTQECLKLTDRRYEDIESLRKDPPSADVLIAGSDQIWNTLFENGKDPSFYLDFGKKCQRRISYAASFATDKIYGGVHFENKLTSLLRNFDRISVRETSGLDILSHLGIENGVMVCDPVFLLSSENWKKLMRKPRNAELNDKFILVYDCETGNNLKSAALEASKQMNAPIYCINYSKQYAEMNFPYEGPREFLWLLANAEFVVSNSFHATAFSLIFNKPIIVVGRTEGINSRMIDLLDCFGLSECFHSPSDTDYNFSNIYSRDNNLMSLYKGRAENYLREELKLSNH